MRTLVALLFAPFLLAGCFSSDAPLFEEARGSCPFTTPTYFVEIGDNSEAPIGITFSAEGGYCRFTKDNGDSERSLFVPIGRNWWIVQEDKAHPSYLLVHRTGQRLMQYLPRCEDFSAQRLDRLHVSYDADRRSCTATGADQIETLFRGWRSPFRRPSGGFREAAG